MRRIEISILFVGDGSYSIYARALYNASLKLPGIKADFFDYGKLNISNIPKKSIVKRLEYHYCIGPDVDRLNRNLLFKCQKPIFDIVFLYSTELIYASTVEKISLLGSYIAIYHNDNPFSKYQKRYRYNCFVNSIKYCNIAYSYRYSNIEDYKNAGADNVKLLRSYYVSDRNFYIDDIQNEDIDIPDVCFVGHFEDDSRIEYIKKILAEGISIGLPEYWKRVGLTDNNIKYLSKCDVNYNKILNKTKIAIVFLSRINQDTYTRRCFEIPATKTMMLAPYTDDLASLFLEDKEAVFYRDMEEFVKKIKYYLGHEKERNAIAEAGYRRIISDGHEAGDRVRSIVKDYEDYRLDD